MNSATRLTLLSVLCLTATVHGLAQRQANLLGERRQIFRDEVSHLKGMKRPVESNYGYYEGDDEQYRPAKPTYQPDQDIPYNDDNYQPEYDDKYKPTYEEEEPYYKPNYESGLKPPYQDGFDGPSYQERPPLYDDYKPDIQENYKPEYNDKPVYQYQEEYRPTYVGNYKPTYQDDYKPSYEDDLKPVFEDGTVAPFDVDYVPTFKPINFNINFFNDDDQRPPYEEDQYESSKPYPPQDYEEYKPSKPVTQKPYKPETPKPYKPRPTYPKEIVMLKPSSALKASAYAEEYATSNYRPNAVPGTPGKDYPNYTAVPETSFDCLSLKTSDYSYLYPDTETGCQVFHSCHTDGRQDSFLCPLGTIFDVKTQTCDWWYNTRCY